MRSKDDFCAEHLIMEQLLRCGVSAGGGEINRVGSAPSDGVHTPAGETINSSWNHTHNAVYVTETHNWRAECAYRARACLSWRNRGVGEGFVGEEGSELENCGRSEQVMPSVAGGRAVGGVSTLEMEAGRSGWLQSILWYRWSLEMYGIILLNN